VERLAAPDAALVDALDRRHSGGNVGYLMRRYFIDSDDGTFAGEWLASLRDPAK